MPEQRRYDVFVSYNKSDAEAAAEKLARWLHKAELSVFFDKWHLIPGEPWQPALEAALVASRACLVLCGVQGLGRWQRNELDGAIDKHTRDGLPRVIPVLLPGARQPGAPELPGFLRQRTWVEFDETLDDPAAYHRLLSGLRGVAPVPPDLEAPPAAQAATPRAGSPPPTPEKAALPEAVTPVLRIEAGMHTAPIRRIDVDAIGRFLVTGSEDKTVRVWDVSNHQLLRILRPPVGEGYEGKIYAVALSPDGELIAVGGWTFQAGTSANIYLFERRSGRMLRRVGGLPNMVNHLVFSPDGARLVATLEGTNGIRVFRPSDGTEIGRDGKYGDRSCGAAFDATGRLVTTCFDGQIRLYDPELHLLKASPAPGGKRPFGVAFSPDGRQIAVGYDDTARVDILATNDLALLFSADTQGAGSGLPSVAWSAGGQVLYAGGKLIPSTGRRIRRWEAAGRGPFRDLPAGGNTVMSLRTLEDGRMVFGSADPAWGVHSPTGQREHLEPPAISDLRALLSSFRTDAGGKRIRFAYQERETPTLFTIPERRLVMDPPDDARLEPPRLEAPGCEVRNWENSYSPDLNGRPLKLETLEIARSLAVAPDGRSFLLGTEWRLRSFTREGTERWRIPVPGIAWAVHLTPDGRLALAGFGDGTIRWYRAEDGQELLAFFPHADRQRWVLWTPGGYYHASETGEDLIGWHLNNGPDQEADFLPAWHFRDRFRQPRVIDLILDTLDEAEAVRRARIGA